MRGGQPPQCQIVRYRRLVVDRDAAAAHALAGLHIEDSLIASAIDALEREFPNTKIA